jgi:hypothetical protein
MLGLSVVAPHARLCVMMCTAVPQQLRRLSDDTHLHPPKQVALMHCCCFVAATAFTRQDLAVLSRSDGTFCDRPPAVHIQYALP